MGRKNKNRSSDNESNHSKCSKDSKTQKKKKPKVTSNSQQSNGSSSVNVMDEEPVNNISELNIRLPPIVVKHFPLKTLMTELKKLNLFVQFKLCRFGTQIITKTKSEFQAVQTYLKNQSAEFYTHDLRCEKPFKVVVRGLPNYEVNDIEEELRLHYKLSPVAVYRIGRKDEANMNFRNCLYLVHFKRGSVTLDSLKAIRSLFSIIVRWERYRGGQRDVTQCQRCQSFGHGSRNCYLKPRCKVCSLFHETNECLAGSETSPKCVNCEGAHQASDRNCPKREEFKKLRSKASATNHQGKQRVNKPAFTIEDFPEMLSSSQRTMTQRIAAQRAPVHGAWSKAPTSTPLQRTITHTVTNTDGKSCAQVGTELPNKFSATEFLPIFGEMFDKLTSCQTRLEQIRCMGEFIIRYGC